MNAFATSLANRRPRPHPLFSASAGDPAVPFSSGVPSIPVRDRSAFRSLLLIVFPLLWLAHSSTAQLTSPQVIVPEGDVFGRLVTISMGPVVPERTILGFSEGQNVKFTLIDQTTVDDPLTVGTTVTLGNGTGANSNLRMAANPSTGEFLAIWEHNSNNGDPTDVQAQLFDSNANPLTSVSSLGQDLAATTFKSKPSVTFDADTGNFVVTFLTSASAFPSHTGVIQALNHDLSSASLTAPIGINAFDGFATSIATAGSNSYFVSVDDPSNSQVHVGQFNTAGQVLSPVASFTGGQSDLVADGSDPYLLVTTFDQVQSITRDRSGQFTSQQIQTNTTLHTNPHATPALFGVDEAQQITRTAGYLVTFAANDGITTQTFGRYMSADTNRPLSSAFPVSQDPDRNHYEATVADSHQPQWRRIWTLQEGDSAFNEITASEIRHYWEDILLPHDSGWALYETVPNPNATIEQGGIAFDASPPSSNSELSITARGDNPNDGNYRFEFDDTGIIQFATGVTFGEIYNALNQPDSLIFNISFEMQIDDTPEAQVKSAISRSWIDINDNMVRDPGELVLEEVYSFEQIEPAKQGQLVEFSRIVENHGPFDLEHDATYYTEWEFASDGDPVVFLDNIIVSVSGAAIPEPTTLALLAIAAGGLLCLTASSRHKNSNHAH